MTAAVAAVCIMAAMPDRDGIDISHWNPIANWDDIPEFDLWCMKATEGKGFRSPVFDENWVKARDLNVKYLGAYHWIRSDSTAEQQIVNLKRAIDDHGGLREGEFVMLDWERTPSIPDVPLGKVTEWLDLAEAEWPGKVITYVSDWVPHFEEWRTAYPDAPLWYANYRLVNDSRGGAAETDKWGADVWQWTSQALVPGFADPTIDMNDVLDWTWFETLYEDFTPPPIIEPPPPPVPILYMPPDHWALFPLDKNKPDLHPSPARSNQSKPHIMYLQDALRLKAGQWVTTDGWFGPQTEQAVRRFQKFFNGLEPGSVEVDGWVGSQTWPLIDLVVAQ